MPLTLLSGTPSRGREVKFLDLAQLLQWSRMNRSHPSVVQWCRWEASWEKVLCVNPEAHVHFLHVIYTSSDDTLRQSFSGLCMEIVFGVEFFFVVSCQHSKSYGILSILNFGLSWHNLYWNWAVGIAQRQTILIVCEAAQCWNSDRINPCVPCSNYPLPYSCRERDHARGHYF